jgi:acyl transferase domain-containing protein/NAD(P)H-dependent flavin oxidoreductase YrpB (nitropropane dioxygenase family)/NAD(P)-dependent dehydrogenase (short-subunit alcohol dehydrogenase family)
MQSLVVGCTPFEMPDARLAAAVGRTGALAILDLGSVADAALAALAALERDSSFSGSFGVRVSTSTSRSTSVASTATAGATAAAGACSTSLSHASHAIDAAHLPRRVDVVVLDAGAPIAPWRPRRVIVQVTSVTEARAAIADGADGLVAKGNESGGRVGEETSFVLLQRLRGALGASVPIWLQGGIGVHTAAAAILGGATGVWLDSQLALCAESSIGPELRRTLGAFDGSETVIVEGRRVLAPRPGLSTRVALGQDAAFARPLAERFRNVTALVRGLESSITQHIADAAALDPLAPGSPLAAAHGLRYPIAQGPMTRVSDRAAFAESVAAAGGLPFIALSLMRASEARPLLEETRAKCDARGLTGGVGTLGFVPQELRDEQLALLRDIRPPVVLIAGGRPSQAQPLEEVGIPCYLHVPSPGLLDLFLKDGARRFVLEGRECGGHVGPRSSFVLWEGAIERLANDPVCQDVSVLFAGGIHDGRSAAMVAAAAAPLAARGAKIGVLAGTAYLFTREAVDSGAIMPAFQAEAVACGETVLLDTGPGHSTRCAETDYVRAFRDERARLEREGADPRAMWEALEQLNLGRLRIAAKGLVRGEVGLVDVDEPTQRREGMYMIGQVAALRDQVVTMAELHADIAEGSSRELAAAHESTSNDRTDRHEAARGTTRHPRVAIVGMATILPGAPDLDAYWKTIVTNANAVTEVPRERWNTELYYDPSGTGDKTPSKWGGFLGKTPFDPAKFGIPPRSLAAIEPVQLLALEVSRRALVDAGYAERPFDRERASVIFGAEAGTDLSSQLGFRAQHRGLLGEMPEELDKALPTLTEDSFPGVLANVIAGRIANRLDLGGVNFTVDAACASSLAALDMACKELATGESDLVLCGGADLHNGIVDYLMFASVHALSPTGRCRTFDASADGIALGEGVCAVVLKRLEDAERDGDRIYAVVDGVGGSSDGKSLGLTAPRKEGQMRALARAYARANVSPADVELVEAHGTGTVVGDRTELATLTEVFAAAGAKPGQTTLGSVKSQIGHTKCAAGLAGLIKAALAIHHRVLPPTHGLKKPNPYYDAAKSPFVFRDRAQPWASARRLAGVSAFGFGGTNFHAVLSSYDGAGAPEAGLSEWPVELFVLRGKTRVEAEATAERLVSLAASGEPYRLRDLAAGAAARQAGQPVWISFVASSLEEVATRARAAIGAAKSLPGVCVRDADAEKAAGGSLALVFPGQGSQRPGMLDDLLVAFPQLGELVALGRRWAQTMYPGMAFSPEERAAQKAAITDTRVAQPTLGIADLAMLRALERAGVKGQMVAGHSYGELVALCAAGVYDEATLLELSAARAQCILDAAAGEPSPGTMAAVRAGMNDVARVLGEDSDVVFANLNAPDQTVIAGSEVAVDAAVARLGEARVGAKRIPVACAFHSPIVAGGAVAFEAKLAQVALRSPDRPVFANTTAAPYPADVAALRTQLAQQLARPVRWAEEIEAMYAAGARTFVEAGPGNVLGDLVKRVLGDRPHVVVSCDRPGESSLAALLGALARLGTCGVDLDLTALFAGRGVQAMDLDRPPRVAPPATAWWVDGMLARPITGELPPFAMRPLLEPVKPRVEVVEVASADAAQGHGGGQVQNERESAVLEYLRGMRELVEGQKQVMMRFLGATAVAAPELAPAIETRAVVAPAMAAGSNGHANGKANGHVNGHVNGAANGTNGHAKAAVVAAKAAPAPAPVVAKRAALDVLVGIVAERTGYPTDMLDPDLDLEADLGIDSIKRIEILGTLSEQLGLGMGDGKARSELVEEVAAKKTLRAIAQWVDAQQAKLPAAAAPAPAIAVEAAAVAVAAPVTSAAPAPAAKRAALDVLVAIVAERTGYPTEMLEPDLDLEADLGIDSIKRIEILGTLSEQLGLAMGDGKARSEMVEEVAAKKTLRAIAQWVEAQQGGAPAASLASAPPAPAPPVAEIPEILGMAEGSLRHALPAVAAAAAAADPNVTSVRRYVLRPSPLPPAVANGFVVDGRRFVLTDDGRGVATALAKLLTVRGARVQVLHGPPDELGRVDGVIHLAPLSASESPGDARKHFWELARAAVLGGAEWLLATTAQAGTPGARPEHGGLAGIVKSVAKEWPTLRARAIDLDASVPADELAALLYAELLSDDAQVHVSYAGGARVSMRPVAAEPEAIVADVPLLGKDDVVLITGGARGITARTAIALAQRYGATIELCGRSPLPAAEDPTLAGCAAAAALRATLLARAQGEERTPAKINATVTRLLADREIRATLATLATLGSRPRYHAVDVRDEAALGGVIDDIYARHGRLDALVHGAGVIEDKLLKHKTRESFDRVFDTKVGGAQTILAKIRPGTRYVVFFSSVSGTFGNRGQTDYAAANEALDHLAHHAQALPASPRVLSVAWGPWAETGMISPELEREYQKRGVGLIPPAEGIERLFTELSSGSEAHVVFMSATPESLEG